MFELILTVCLLGQMGQVECSVPATGYYLNKDRCEIDQAKAPGVAIDAYTKQHMIVKSVEAKCQPFGQTPVKS